MSKRQKNYKAQCEKNDANCHMIYININLYAQTQLLCPSDTGSKLATAVHSSPGNRRKPFRILTGWLVGGQVFEMDAFDDLHGEAPCRGVVHQAHEDLRCGGLTDRLERRGAFAARHIREADLRLTSLKTQTHIVPL